MDNKKQQPAVFFDLETTGLSDADRIVEICIIRRDGDEETCFSTLVDPQQAMPEEAAEITHITNDMLRGQPTFDQVAARVRSLMAGADLVGYNIRRFDIPMLQREFARVRGFPPWAPEGAVLDLLEVFYRREPRDLAGALRFYQCVPPEGEAHRAEADVRAVMALLEGQRERYPDLRGTLAEMAAAVRDPAAVDEGGKLKRSATGQVVLTFGKHAGVALDQCPPSYLRWALDKGVFGPDAVPLIKAVLS